MLGGNFSGFSEGNCSQYNQTTSPQLQLLGHVPSGLDMINCVNNERAPTDNHPTRRFREEEHRYMQQKLDISANTNLHLNRPGFREDHRYMQQKLDISANTNLHLNRPGFREEHRYMQQKLDISANTNLHLNRPGHHRLLLNPNPVSSGLRLSSEKEERTSSVTSTSENMTNASPFALSLGNTVKMEIDRQMEELGQYIKLWEENILKIGREITERHTISLLNSLEKGVNKKLQEKDIEIENMNQKNKELEDRIKQVAIEAQSWHYKAKYNESVANALKSHIEQLLAQGMAQGQEGFGDSELDDTLSSLKQPPIITRSPENLDYHNHRIKCRLCNKKQASVLLLPCRHLCLCAECEVFVEVCPVCQVMKTASLHVNL